MTHDPKLVVDHPVGPVAWCFEGVDGDLHLVNMTWGERSALEKADYPIFMPDAFSRERTLVEWMWL